ncbi:LDH2 family malate/lactate/ureidoglycolate dehydrogenase [Bradyrhizobium japonicum]
MPIVKTDRLTLISAALLRAAGASDEEADAVATGCVNANLAGHDSHGVIAVPTYIDRIKAGHIVPGAKWTIVQESPTTTVIDGQWGFGFHVNAKAMALTIEKAKTANVAACTVFRQSHVGRLAAYPLMAMREGMIGIATADSGRSPKHVAPFGGKEARLGTNPISIAVPSDLDAPFYLDMATSAVAAGKIQLAVAPRRGDSDGLDHRCRGTAHHRPHAISQGRRAAAARRHRRLQGQRSRRHGRGAVRPAHRFGIRRRADRAS